MGVSLFSFTITIVVMGIQTFLVGIPCRFLGILLHINNYPW